MGRRPVPADFFHVMKTYAPKPRDIQRRWYVIDADGAVLGRLATEVASSGTSSARFTPRKLASPRAREGNPAA